MKKRILSILLTLVMVIGMLPTVAFAEETTDVELFDALDIFLQIGSTVCADYGDESFRVTEDPVNGAWNVTYTVQKIANYEYLYNINVNLKDVKLAATESISFHYKGKAHSDCDHAYVSFNVHAEGDCYVPTIGASAEVSEENKANNTGVVDSSMIIHVKDNSFLRTNYIDHHGVGRFGGDITLTLLGGNYADSILMAQGIINYPAYINYAQGGRIAASAEGRLNIIKGGGNGALFETVGDYCEWVFQKDVNLFLRTLTDKLFDDGISSPVFYADKTYGNPKGSYFAAYNEDQYLRNADSGVADTATVGDVIDYHFRPEFIMPVFGNEDVVDRLSYYENYGNEHLYVVSNYKVTNLTTNEIVATGTVDGMRDLSATNPIKITKDGNPVTYSKAGIYRIESEVVLMFYDQVIHKAVKTHYVDVQAKPLVTPTITQQPQSITNATGDVTLTAKAENATRARWYVEKSDGTVAALGDALTDGTSTQTISKASNAVGNRYFCAFWSEDDKIAKTELVTVCFAPTVDSNGNVTVAAGNTAFLKVTENGCGHYAAANGWYKDGVELTSGDKYYIMGTTLAVQNAAAEDEGTYTYKYVTEHGDEVTANVTLTVNTGSSSTTIDTFDITGLDNPVILGTVADTSVSVPTGANYTVESVTWTAGVNGSGVVTGSSGVVSIKLKAKDSYTFKSGDLAGTVEGIYKTVYSVPANATEITVNVDYNNFSSWKIAYPANDTISISTDSLTFKVGTAANGQEVEGAFNCTHSGLADTNLHHTGMKYAVYSIADNAMPAGLTLNADGTITGTPTTAGVYTVMVRADSVNASGTASNCSGLAVKAIEIVVESDAHTHDWDIENPVEVIPANCTTDGTSKITCKDTSCNESVEITVPATGHNWGEWNNGAPIITPRCTDANDLVIERTCSNANCPVGTESKTISRIHMAMDWTTDETHHWKVCGYCGTEILVEKEAHEDTDSDNKCDTCGYDMTPAVQPTKITDVNATVAEPVVGGTPSTVATTTGTDYTVFVRGWYDEEENTVSVFEAGKTYTLEVGFTPKEGYVLAGSNTLNATINDKEAEYLSLDAINGTVTCFIRYTIPAVVPTEYDITVTGGTASANKAVAGTEITLTVDESAIPAGKVFDKWEVVSGGVTVTDGKFTMPESAVEINATYKDAPVSHTCDIKPVAKDEPSCTEGGKEAYYKCEGCGKFYEDALGAKEITDLANWGNLPKLGHTESDWKSDKDNHWKECTVTACGVIIEDSKAAHKDDNKDGKCDVCEYNVGLPTTPDDDKPNDNPQTGDNSNMFLWISLLMISGAGVVATTVFGKKKFSVK